MKREEARAMVASLYESWYPSLVGYVHRRTGDLAQAEDVVQDSFIELYKALRDGCEFTNIKAWTLTVVRRQISRRIRENARVISISDPLAHVSDIRAGTPDPLAKIEMDEITRMFSVLTQREEEVLLLRLEALKYREIARQLGIGGTSVNTLLARALQKLRQVMGVRETRESIPDHEGTTRNGA